ncbi:head decoration protein [Acinetobacter bereziniae]|uniref:head decoration protein n=1 Tax=Acinetobacter bereziniae TaxID=106648 RepID=UPI00066847A8|nr:head decoration protein [Acinetobacter bereziniae]
MGTYTEPTHLSDVLLVEVKQGWTKQNGMLSATTIALGIGVVLAQLASGEYTPVDFAGNGAAKKAAAVLATTADVSTTAQKTVVIKRGAVVAKNNLVFPEGATDAQITTALAELEALGIVAQNAL